MSLATPIRIPRIDKVFLLIMVLCSGTLINQDFSLLLLIPVAWVSLLFKKRVEINVRLTMWFGIFFAYWLISIDTRTLEQYMKLIKMAIVMYCVVSYFASRTDDIKDVIHYFFRIILFFSILSSIIYLLYLIGFPLPVITREFDMTFYYMESISPEKVFGFLNYRNYGIYWEPGMYQVYLNLLLIYVLFYGKNILSIKKYVSLIVYIVLVIISTGSITGFLALAIITFFYVIRNNNKYIKIAAYITLPILLVFLIPFFQNLFDVKATNDSGSYEKRTIDLVTAYTLFLQKPLLGFGLVNNAYTSFTADLFEDMRGCSNGFSNLLINFGLIGTSFCMLLLIKASKVLKQHFDINALCFLVIFILSLNSEPFQQHPLFYMFLGIGVMTFGRRKKTPRLTLKEQI